MIKEVNDEFIMPWGKYRGEKLANIPSGYLLWLENEIKQKSGIHWSVFEKQLMGYIQKNMDILITEIEQEHENLKNK